MEVDNVCYPCQATITPRGNFFSDKYFDSARKTLEDLVTQMQNCCNRQVQWPPGKVDYLLAELGAWQQSGQNLGAAMGTCRHDELFTTVFRFEPDNLKVLFNVLRDGYVYEDKLKQLVSILSSTHTSSGTDHVSNSLD